MIFSFWTELERGYDSLTYSEIMTVSWGVSMKCSLFLEMLIHPELFFGVMPQEIDSLSVDALLQFYLFFDEEVMVIVGNVQVMEMQNPTLKKIFVSGKIDVVLLESVALSLQTFAVKHHGKWEILIHYDLS